MSTSCHVPRVSYVYSNSATLILLSQVNPSFLNFDKHDSSVLNFIKDLDLCKIKAQVLSVHFFTTCEVEQIDLRYPRVASIFLFRVS